MLKKELKQAIAMVLTFGIISSNACTAPAYAMSPANAGSSAEDTPEATVQESTEEQTENEQDSAGSEENAAMEETTADTSPTLTEQATPEQAAPEGPEASTAAEKCVAYEHESDADGICTICGTDLIAEFNALYETAMNGTLIADMNRYGWYEQTGDAQYADAEAAAMESYEVLQNALEVFTCFELSVDTDTVLALKEKEQALHELASAAEAAYAYPQDPATFGSGKGEEEQGDELLFGDLPDAPTGSYMGSYGLPVATGETKISISAWNNDLYADTAYMDADALNADNLTMITAAEDIYTQDRQLDANRNRTLWYAKGDVVTVVSTGNGKTDEVTFAPARTTAAYDFLSVIHNGTVGEVSVTLPLGSYHVEETTPPYGFIGTAESYDVGIDCTEWRGI